MRAALLFGAVALLEPLDPLDRCVANLEEVGGLVGKAKDRAKAAKAALEKERQALEDSGEDGVKQKLEIEKRNKVLAEETTKLNELATAVNNFGSQLESRRVALQDRMDNLQQDESLRRAYSEIVRNSEMEIATFRKSAEESGSDDMMVQLEVKEGKLAEERERLKAVEQRVAGALEQLETETNSWKADKAQYATFKTNLKEKMDDQAKLQGAIREMEDRAEELANETEEKKASIEQMKGKVAGAQAELRDAVEQLVQEQGTALDYLSEALRECQSKPPEIVEKKVEVEVEVEKIVPSPVPCPTTTTTTTPEPSTEEKLEEVADRVENGVTDSIRGFAEALAAANGKDAASEPEEKEAVKPKEDTTPPPPAITDDLKKLQEHLNLTAMQGPTNAARARAHPRRNFLRAKVL
jgi:chromosome segregation ATPase